MTLPDLFPSFFFFLFYFILFFPFMTDNLQEAEQEAKRWMIIGAHQAGATERKIARISGLSTTAVRHILLNYQQNGTPSIPKQVPKRGNLLKLILLLYLNIIK